MTSRIKLTIALLAGLAVSGCVQKQLSATCYDGWTTDEAGTSEVFQPSDEERIRILEAISPASSATCFHALARGDIKVVFSDRSTATVRKTPDGYELVERGKIVSVN